jgi:signal transduction histidine kinase
VPSVLLVHPDAEQWLGRLSDLEADVTTAATAKEARAYLAFTAFDAVYVGPGVEGGEAIGALRDVLGLSTRVDSVAGPDEVAERFAEAGGAESGEDPVAALESIRGELGRIAHALNNPLAVIAGNAQLGLEMARATGADESVAEALESIGAAATKLEGLFSEISGLRARVDRALGR